jgi:transcription elongation factor Elf1
VSAAAASAMESLPALDASSDVEPTFLDESSLSSSVGHYDLNAPAALSERCQSKATVTPHGQSAALAADSLEAARPTRVKEEPRGSAEGPSRTPSPQGHDFQVLCPCCGPLAPRSKEFYAHLAYLATPDHREVSSNDEDSSCLHTYCKLCDERVPNDYGSVVAHLSVSHAYLDLMHAYLASHHPKLDPLGATEDDRPLAETKGTTAIVDRLVLLLIPFTPLSPYPELDGFDPADFLKVEAVEARQPKSRDDDGDSDPEWKPPSSLSRMPQTAVVEDDTESEQSSLRKPDRPTGYAGTGKGPPTSRSKKSKSKSRRNFSCETCGKAFPSQYHLDRHVRVHTGERPFGCRVCDARFAVAYNRRAHERQYHPNFAPEKETVQPTKKAQKVHFKRSLYCHSPELYHLLMVPLQPSRFKCLHCEQSFPRQALLDK